MKTLKEYFLELQEFMLNNPDSHNLKVVYCKDDEGNEFNFVPDACIAKGFFDNKRNDFVDHKAFDDYGVEEEQLNAVCIN